MQQVVFQGKIYAAKTPLILLLRLLAKTTACFEENDTLFLGKRHVVLMKTTRCFWENDGLFERNYGWIEERLSNNPFMGLFFRGLCKHCDTCDSKKAKIPVGRTRTRA